MAITVIQPQQNRGLQDILGIVNTINDFRRLAIERDREELERARTLAGLGLTRQARTAAGGEPLIMPAVIGQLGMQPEEQPQIQLQPQPFVGGTISALPKEQFSRLLETGMVQTRPEKIRQTVEDIYIAQKKAQKGKGTSPFDFTPEQAAALSQQRDVAELQKSLGESPGGRLTTFGRSQQRLYDKWIAKKPSRAETKQGRGWLRAIARSEQKSLDRGEGVVDMPPPEVKSKKGVNIYAQLTAANDWNNVEGDTWQDKAKNLRAMVVPKLKGLSPSEQFEVVHKWWEVQSFYDTSASTQFFKPDYADKILFRLQILQGKMSPSRRRGGRGGGGDYYVQLPGGEWRTVENTDAATVYKTYPKALRVKKAGKGQPPTVETELESLNKQIENPDLTEEQRWDATQKRNRMIGAKVELRRSGETQSEYAKRRIMEDIGWKEKKDLSSAWKK
jgi:hypothetical protein